MKKMLISLLLCIGLAQGHQSPMGFASNPRRAITPSVKQFAQEVISNGSVPGMTLGVVHSDGFVEFERFGNKTEDGDITTVDTLFNIASCSKNILASALGILMDDFAKGRNVTPLPEGMNRFDWYTKVKDILPEDWKLMDEWATEKATFRDIMSHQSGLPRHDLSNRPYGTALDVIHRMHHLRPAFELRQRFHYNNQMYTLGAHVISKYSGMAYPDFAKARIFAPLNMSTTTFSADEASRSGLLTQSWTKFGRRIPFWMPDDLVDVNAGPGGVISSVVDMTKWLGVLLNGGKYPFTHATIVPPETFEMATSAQIVAAGKAAFPEFSLSGYGFGLGRLSYQGHEILTHAGGVPGFSAEVYVLPSDGLGIVALANADEKQSCEMAVIYRVIEDYLGLEHKASARFASLPLSDVQFAGFAPSSVRPKSSIQAPSASFVENTPLQNLTGVYTNGAYPTLTLCDPKTSRDIPKCHAVFEMFESLEDLSASNDTLYCAFPNLWISHARLTRNSGNHFNLAGTYIFPEGYGRDRTPFETSETGQSDVDALFIIEDGVVKGLAINGFVGELTESQRIGGSPQETAEVWYEKV